MAFTNIGFDVFESERLLSEQEGSVTDEMRGEDGRVGTFPTLAEAQAEADRLAAEVAPSVEVTPTRYGIGCVEYMVYEVFCFGDDEDGETVLLGADGNEAAFDTPLGGASALDHRPDVRAAWKTALASYCDFLDYKEDCYETVGMVLERSREIERTKAGPSL